MTAELWTPGSETKRRTTPLWIPPEAREDVLGCTLCKTTFPRTQRERWRRHVERCANQLDDVIQAEIAEKEADPILSPMDKERAEYLRKNPRNRGRKSRHLKGIVG